MPHVLSISYEYLIGVLNLYLSRECGLTNKSRQIGSGELEVAVHGNLLSGRSMLHAWMISTGVIIDHRHAGKF